MGKYDIFISYRRDGGETLACLFKDRLSQLGYKVFYDLESLRSGTFDNKIYDIIKECRDFVLILPKNGLDRCVNENDWVRREIVKALNYKKNIVPVMMRDFNWPIELPEELKPLQNYNGLTVHMEYFDATCAKLLKLLSVSQQRTFSSKDYTIMYYSFSPVFKRRTVFSKMIVDEAGHAVLYDNVKNNNIDTADYIYHGLAVETDTNIYIRLDNDVSSEKLNITLVKGAGNLNRYIGIICGLSSAMLPVCFKCVFIANGDIDSIDESVLEMVIEHSNKEWNGNLLAVESFQVNVFFSEAFLKEK